MKRLYLWGLILCIADSKRKKVWGYRLSKAEKILDSRYAQTGIGNTNDGNTARRAYEIGEIFTNIKGVVVDVIIRLRTIL